MHKTTAPAPIRKKKSLVAWGLGITAAALIFAVVGLALGWYLKNRADFRKDFAVRVHFDAIPDTVRAGHAAHFVLHVRGQDGRPLPGRSVTFSVSPPASARIVAVTGASGERLPETASVAHDARTDSEGNTEAWIQASVPGRYTVVGSDSVSVKSAALQFQVH